MKKSIALLCFVFIQVYGQDFELVVDPIVKKARELARQHALNPELSKPIIAIAGCTGVGKSYFTNQLAAILKLENIKVAILKHDDFIQKTPVEHALIHPQFDHKYLHAVIQQIFDGKEHIKKPVWNRIGLTTFKQEEVACFWDIDLILFEGIYTLCDATNYDFLKYSSLRIFIDASEKDMVTWNWNREIEKGQRARTKEKFDADVAWDMQDYKNTVEPTKRYADFIINKNTDHTYTLSEQDACLENSSNHLSNF